MGAETFSIRWTGELEARYSEIYTFNTRTDDGVRLWVNNQLLIDKWESSGNKEYGGTIALEAGQKYDIKVEYKESTGNAVAQLYWQSNSQIKEIIPTNQLYSILPTPTPPGTGNGLVAQYYDNADLTNLSAIQIDPSLNFNWGENPPQPGMGAETFSIRWTGELEARYSEIYTFNTRTDDGVRLWVNNQLIIDKWESSGNKEYGGTIALEAGQKYDIKVEYKESTGNARAQLYWQSNSQSKEIIPTNQLYSTLTPPFPLGMGTGLIGKYYDNNNFSNEKLTRTDTTINFDWGNNSPAPELGADTFSILWTGVVQPLYTDNYLFSSRVDDSVRLWVDNQLLIDKWESLGNKEYRGSIALEAGKQYDIRLEYKENTGKAIAQLFWESNNQIKQIIPTTQLYPQRSLLEITASLANDTGTNSQDGITNDPTIQGQILSNTTITSFQGQILGSARSIELKDILNTDGTFTLRQAHLENINGSSLSDGNYQFQIIATDSNGTTKEIIVNLNLDRTLPIINLATPIAQAQHSSTARLIGTIAENDLETSEYSLDGGNLVGVIVDDEGKFDTPLNTTIGNHFLTVTSRDRAGNSSSQNLNFSVVEDFSIGGIGTTGWGIKNNQELILAERDSLVVQTSLPIELGLSEGSRLLSFDIDAQFDKSNPQLLEDRLLVYLVDPNNPERSLLDNRNSFVFSLAGNQAEYRPGLTSYDGQTVKIDLSSIADVNSGLLVFQLINQDRDARTQIQISHLTNTLNPTGTPSPLFPLDNNLILPGGDLDEELLSVNNSLEPIFSNLHLEGTTYRGQVQVKNQGEPIGRNLAVLFPNLPEGVTLNNPSGMTSQGIPYLNFQPSIANGGLATGEISARVEFSLDNPNLVRFDLEPILVSGSTNVAPLFEPLEPIVINPGASLTIPLIASDGNGERVNFRLLEWDSFPTGQLIGSGQLILAPAPEDIGTYQIEIAASDGALETVQTIEVNVVADPITTTRISGKIENTDREPLAGITIALGDGEVLTQADGSFQLEFSTLLPSDTLKVHGEEVTGNEVYPFIAEKLHLLLGHEVYRHVNNIISRPIYLPPLDVASGSAIDFNRDTTVTSVNIPGASVLVEAGTLTDQTQQPFTGVLSITEVPVELTPAALPRNFTPDLVVTIQPGDMVFSAPAPLSLPNTSGWGAGMEMDLWSINPLTGDFDKVGIGRVSADGRVVETIDGGIRNSSWHFFAPPPLGINNNSPNEDCNDCKERREITSQVELDTGAIIESHDLVTYSSNGVTRGITLTYDSLRADPRPIINFSHDNVNPQLMAPGFTERLRLMAQLKVMGNGFDYEVPGFVGGQYGLTGGEHFWSIPNRVGEIGAALQVDGRELPSGKYDYTLTSGIRLFVREQFIGSSSDTREKILHVNGIDSAFGSGWGIAGWQYIVENSDGSLLLVDGDGGEMYFEAPSQSGGVYGNPH
jgi:hypothetical protein